MSDLMSSCWNMARESNARSRSRTGTERGPRPLIGTLSARERGMLSPVKRLARHARLVLLGIAIAGCGSPPELDEQLDTLASWTAMVQLATAEHRAHAIPTRYAIQLDDAARKALEETRHTVGAAARSAAAAADDRVIAAVDSLQDAIDQLAAETRW
jgi:hypothetical protein